MKPFFIILFLMAFFGFIGWAFSYILHMAIEILVNMLTYL